MVFHPSIHLEIARQRARAIANNPHPSPTGGKHMSAPARELAKRQSGTDEVQLFWHPESERVELSIRDLATGAGFHVEVAPASAIDAFYHPFAYLARRETPDGAVRVETTTIDG
jgi:hypothetical protein